MRILMVGEFIGLGSMVYTKAATLIFAASVLCGILTSATGMAQEVAQSKMSGKDAAIAGQAAVEKGDYETAIDLFLTASNSDDLTLVQKAVALNDCGIIYERQQKIHEALRAYSSAIAMNPDYAAPYYSRANLEAANAQFDVAISDYTSALRLAPKTANYYFSRGIAYADRGQLDLAIEDETVAIQNGKAFAEAYIARATDYLFERDVVKAIPDFNTAIQLQPSFEDAYARRGLAHRMNHEYAESVADYDKAIALKPDDAAAYVNRGIALFDLGKFSDAAKSFATYKALNPRNIYGVLWMHVANLKLKIDDSSEMIAAAPKFDLSTWPQGVMDLYLGRTSEDQLLALLRDPGAGSTDNPLCTAPFYVGEYEIARGDAARARTFLQQTASADNCLQGEVEAASEELARLPK